MNVTGSIIRAPTPRSGFDWKATASIPLGPAGASCSVALAGHEERKADARRAMLEALTALTNNDVEAE
jgi:hypothetical protein